uniref:Uncharacterized protein n=1 Tax=Chlamydomonas leiostraca TaxID=1034604 RepID=A0A7S0RQ85_9CHLO|mmetsp:Transcript_28531/g.72590  ORF Transcript_28531/g.72590 Transcript_28531/m.72590 type:complete len:198 (+) Transcript_28531:80-673(+)
MLARGMHTGRCQQLPKGVASNLSGTRYQHIAQPAVPPRSRSATCPASSSSSSSAGDFAAMLMAQAATGEAPPSKPGAGSVPKVAGGSSKAPATDASSSSRAQFVEGVQAQLAAACAQHGPMVASVLSQQLAALVPVDREARSQWFYAFDPAQRLTSQQSSLSAYPNVCRATAAAITTLPEGHLLRLLLAPPPSPRAK